MESNAKVMRSMGSCYVRNLLQSASARPDAVDAKNRATTAEMSAVVSITVPLLYNLRDAEEWQ